MSSTSDSGPRLQAAHGMNNRQASLDMLSSVRWQSNADISDRRRVLFSIMKVMERLDFSTNASREQLPFVAKAFEQHLYLSAASKEEYVNPSTLKERLRRVAGDLGIPLGTVATPDPSNRPAAQSVLGSQDSGWRSGADLADRLTIVNCIAKILEQMSDQMNPKRIPCFATKLEERLYRCARSRSEYLDRRTLKERLRSVAQELYHKSTPTTTQSSTLSNTTLTGTTNLNESQENILNKCYEILFLLKEEDKKGGSYFVAPVDVVKFGIPEYSQVISHPMDLGTISTKMETGEITTAEEFARLVRLVFQNAILFNAHPEHVVHKTARLLLKDFEDKYREVEKMLVELDNCGKKAEKEEPKRCVICYESEPTHAFIPCGHQCVCDECASSTPPSKLNRCFVCRGESLMLLKIYR